MKVQSTVGLSRQLASAYSLVEVVIAVAVISIAFVSLYIGLSFGFAVTTFDRQDLRATQIMLERMEGIRLFTFDQVSNTNLNPLSFTNYFYPKATGSQAQGIPYYGTVTVSSLALNPSATYSTNIKRVTVTIQWTSGDTPSTRSMSTLVARHGAQNYIYSNGN
jgi:ribose/xylose/arabinose/galactoside ABC-type transport system permease subunit